VNLDDWLDWGSDADLTFRYHRGEVFAQERTQQTVEAQRLGSVIKPFLTGGAGKFIGNANVAMACTVDATGQPQLSPMLVKCDSPFGTVGSSGVTIPRSALSSHDPLFANLADDRRVGLLFFEPATRRRYRVNGEAVDSRAEPLEVSIVEAYPNCPKYIVRQECQLGPGLAQSGPTYGDIVHDVEATLLENTSLFFVGSCNPTGQLDAASRSGDPGFVRRMPDGSFLIPDFPGNAAYQTFGNLLIDPRAAIGVFDHDTFVSFFGTVEVLWESDLHGTGGTGRAWHFRPGAWARIPLKHSLSLTGFERSRQTPETSTSTDHRTRA
jgi:predicted pyridoxine 5'-phosphate oxidase superfamily flavin-nucleotide-binding protein